jgi:hypothetical protein
MTDGPKSIVRRVWALLAVAAMSLTLVAATGSAASAQQVDGYTMSCGDYVQGRVNASNAWTSRDLRGNCATTHSWVTAYNNTWTGWTNKHQYVEVKAQSGTSYTRARHSPCPYNNCNIFNTYR